MSTHDGPVFGEADFDFEKEEKVERKQVEQPNFDFLSGVKETPQEVHVAPVNNSNGPADDFDFNVFGTPTTSSTPPSYTPPTYTTPSYTPPQNF